MESTEGERKTSDKSKQISSNRKLKLIIIAAIAAILLGIFCDHIFWS